MTLSKRRGELRSSKPCFFSLQARAWAHAAGAGTKLYVLRADAALVEVKRRGKQTRIKVRGWPHDGAEWNVYTTEEMPDSVIVGDWEKVKDQVTHFGDVRPMTRREMS